MMTTTFAINLRICVVGTATAVFIAKFAKLEDELRITFSCHFALDIVLIQCCAFL